MKPKLLLLACCIALVGYTQAQVAPLYFYSDRGTKSLQMAYSDNNIEKFKDSTGGAVVAYEGASQLFFKFKNLGGWGSGLGNFTIGPYVENPPGSGTYLPEKYNFTAYTHVQFAWKGNASNDPTSTLAMYFEDAAYTGSTHVSVASPSTAAGYQFASIPLSSFGTGIDWTQVGNMVFLLDQLGNATYYIDELRLVDCSAPAPTISTFTTSGEVGDLVTINGTNLQNVSSVSFNGITTGRISNVTNTSFQVEVPSGATDGTLTVNTCTAVTSTASFDVLAPAITSFSPASGSIGSTVTLTGTNLSQVTSISFNGGVTTSISNLTSTSLDVVVPVSATTGTISATSPSGTGVSATTFTVSTVIPAPTITSLSSSSGMVGDLITITGTNLANTTGVTFNGVNAPAFTAVSATSLTVTVPSGATDGVITVTTTTGAVSSASFDVLSPTFTSFTPSHGIVGDMITISGTNFTGLSSVTINGKSITSFGTATATSIQLTVPVGASTGLISVVTPSGTASSTTSWRLDTLDIYTDLRDSMDNMWNGNADCIYSKVSDPSNAFEGDSVFIFQYKITSATSASGYYAGFGADLGASAGFDLTKFTHMKTNGKGTSVDYPSNRLIVGFIDAQGDQSSEVQVAAITGGYVLEVYNLISEVKKDSANFDLDQVKGFYAYVGDLAGQFQPNNSFFYLDNFKFVYDPSLGGPVTNVNGNSASMEVTIAPNPSSGIYGVNTSENIEEILVADYLGNLVFKKEVNTLNPQIDLSAHPDGLYFVTLSSKGKNSTKKLIKNR